MRFGLAVSCLALLAVPTLAEATPTTIAYTALKNSQGLGGDTLTGSFTFDLSLASTVQTDPANNSATYSLVNGAQFQFTTGSITEQGGGPLTIRISAGADAQSDQFFEITGFTQAPEPNPQIRLILDETNSPHDLTGDGAPTFLTRADWSDASVNLYTLSQPQQLIGQYLIQTIAVVDEPGTLPVLAMGLLALLGLSWRRKLGTTSAIEIAS
jgi:hypothetical protein